MISIVVPALNEEKLIRECLESLQNQDCSDYEILVVDNGSHDNTAHIARELGVRVVTCPKKGVSHARQAGAEAARGEIIVQADADTVYPRNWLSRIEKQFKVHPRAVAVAGTFIYKDPPWWATVEDFLRVFFDLLTVWLFRRPFIISGANFAFYKAALTRIGGYRQDSYSSDQYNIATRLSRLGRVIFDRNSKVFTSNRSVDKPLWKLAVAFITNIATFIKNASRGLTPATAESSPKRRKPSLSSYFKIVIPLLLIGIAAYGYFVPASPVFGKVYYKGKVSEKLIALTFDDGPNDPYTTQILDILAEHNVRATFFVVGANVIKYPDTVRRMVAEGHVIGNHTYSHNANHALYLSYYKDIELAQQTIYEVTGYLPHLYRPPHGKKSPWEMESLKRLGLISVVWSASTNELGKRSPDFLTGELDRKARPGRIILLHDGYGISHDSGRSDKTLTVEILPRLIEKLRTGGYEFVTVSDLLNVPAYINEMK